MTLKVKDKKIITTLFELHGVFLWIKDPDPVFFQIRMGIRVTQKDQIRPDPDPQHWFKVICIIVYFIDFGQRRQGLDITYTCYNSYNYSFTILIT